MTRSRDRQSEPRWNHAPARVLLGIGLTVSLLLSVPISAGPLPAEEASPRDTPSEPAEDRLASLRSLASEDNPDLYLELGREVLEDLSDRAAPKIEAEVRFGIGRALRLGDRYTEAAIELRIAADLAAETGQPDLQTAALADLARSVFFLGELDRCLAICNEALAIPHVASNPDLTWTFENITSAVQLQQGKYAAAIRTSTGALESRRAAGDQNSVAKLLNNIGIAHFYAGDPETALDYFHRARILKSELGQTDGVADMLANIGDIQRALGRYDEALETHNEALSLRRLEGSPMRIALSQRSIASILHDLDRDTEALPKVENALSTLRRLELEPEVAGALAVMAEILAALDHGPEALVAADESLKLAENLGIENLRVSALDALAEAQIAAGELLSATETMDRIRTIEQRLNTAEIRTEFARLHASEAERKTRTELEALRDRLATQTSGLDELRRWRMMMLVGLAVATILAAAGWVLFLTRCRSDAELQQTDTTLLASMERYRRLFDRNLAGVVRADLKGRIRTANRAFAGMLGYNDTDDLNERPFSELAADPERIRLFFRELNDRHEITNRELTLVSTSGQPVSILINAAIVTEAHDESRIIEAIAVDITDRKRSEEDRRRLDLDLQQNQKLESLGVLAGGIAHDFNNMLMAILSNISLAKRSSSNSDDALKRLGEAEEACLRATGLTQQLLTFSKGGRPIRKTATIDHLVEDAASFVARGGNCSVDCRTDRDLWPAEIDEGQIVQVVHNLVLNAIEAMPFGGIITVTTDNAHLTAGDIPTLKPGRYVRLEVIDTGGGIAENEVDRIFDPFFTTKKGQSGLGLATAFSIVRSHGGAVVASSPEDQGARFTVYIPASEEAHSETAMPTDSASSGHGQLLIMDDDEAVRSAAAELLETIGYEVSTAADGAEAITLYAEAMDADRPFDAVVLDLTVPDGVGGRETMTRLLEIDPAVKAIVSSGYSTDPVMANYREHGFSGVAVKPYRLAELARTLEAAIDG